MAESVATVRENDYYGGDLSVAVGEIGDWGRNDVLIQWTAWGGYGRVALVVSADEARRIAAALIEAAERVPA